MRHLTDYTGKCGSCMNYQFRVVNGRIMHWGLCARKDRADYHQASAKACKKYVEEEVERHYKYIEVDRR